MTSIALNELDKAGRSMRVTLFNNTSRPLSRVSIVNHMGNFRVQPPETIEGLTTVEFGSESSGMMTGTEAGCFYHIEGVDGQFEFGWNNPYFGKRGYKKSAPPGFDIECSAIDGTNCVVSFVVTETAAEQRSEGEIQKEKLSLDNTILETDKIVKGMQKILHMYQANKDAKNIKTVEGEIAAKMAEMERATARMHSLNLELEKKAKEEDPTYIQQELQRVKEKIEAAVKVRKGIEQMKDMYSAGSQKDPRQAQIVEQQVEGKKREIEALRKFEQKLLDRLTKAKPGTEHVVVTTATAATTTTEKTEGQDTAATPETILSPTIRAKILFDVVPNSDTELALHVGDVISVLDKTGDEWWEGEIDGKRGYFPASYAEIIQNASDGAKAEYAHLYPKATVITEYTASAEGELSLAVGEVLTVYGWDDTYWWEGSKEGAVGFFPCHHVQWVEPEADSSVNVSTSGDFYEDIGKKEDTPTGQSAAPSAPQDQAPQTTQPDQPHTVESIPTPQAPVTEHVEQVPTPQEPTPTPQAEVHQQPEAHQQPEVHQQSEVHQQPEAYQQPEVAPEPQTQPEPISEPQTQPEPEPVQAQVQPEPTPQAQHEQEPQAQPEPEPTPQAQPEPSEVLPIVVSPVEAPTPAQEQPATVEEKTVRRISQTFQPTVVDPQPIRKSSQPPRPDPSITASRPATHDTATVPATNAQQASVSPQSQSPTMARSSTAPLRPVIASQTGNPVRKSISTTAVGGAKPVARALPVPQSSAHVGPGDATRNNLINGLRQKTTEFSSIIEQYTANALGQYLDTIAKLQERVKELEKERDEYKAANEKLLSEQDKGDEQNARFTNRRSFWEQNARK